MAKVAKKQSNPLLLEDVAHRVFNYLDSYTDLKSCYHVCPLWGKLTPPYMIRVQPPVLVKKAMTDDEGQFYIDTIAFDQTLRTTKFKFEEAELSAPSVDYLLQLNGEDMEQLEMEYVGIGEDREEEDEDDDGFQQLHRRSSRHHRRPPLLSINNVRDLLLNKVPFLETLIITALPSSIRRGNLFPDHAKMDSSTHLLLKRIEFTVTYIPKTGLGYSAHFLNGLFAICPKLEQLAINGMVPNAWSGENNHGQKIIRALVNTDRLKQIKVLKIDYADDELMTLLASATAVAPGQLISFELGAFEEPRPFHLREIVTRQSSSLKYLSLPEDDSRHVYLPPMPNLVELKVSKPPYSRHMGFTADDEEDGADNHGLEARNGPCRDPEKILDYINRFPKLRLLGLSGCLVNYQRDEIFSIFAEPASSLNILQEIPLGVDRALMGGIGHLFPNLRIIRTAVPFEQEDMLVSIWEHCPNITELFLTLDEDHTRGGEPGRFQAGSRLSLDAVFSGIPEEKCRRIRLLPFKEQKMELMSADFGKFRGGRPFAGNLKKLRKLSLGGPGKTLLGWCGSRRDKLSDVCGYSTFAYLSPELVFLQVDIGLINISRACTEKICDRLKLEKTDKHGKLPLVRLIRPGLGYNAMGFLLPMEWLGHKGRDVGASDQEMLGLRSMMAA